MKKIVVALSILAIVALAVWLYLPHEQFTVHQVEEPPCISPIHQVDDYLLPHSALFVISGYNYIDNPKIYRDGKVLVPLKFARDYVDMLYYYTVESPYGVCKHTWIVETSDFIKPLVINGREAKELKVDLLERADGKNKWSVEC